MCRESRVVVPVMTLCLSVDGRSTGIVCGWHYHIWWCARGLQPPRDHHRADRLHLKPRSKHTAWYIFANCWAAGRRRFIFGMTCVFDLFVVHSLLLCVFMFVVVVLYYTFTHFDKRVVLNLCIHWDWSMFIKFSAKKINIYIRTYSRVQWRPPASYIKLACGQKTMNYRQNLTVHLSRVVRAISSWTCKTLQADEPKKEAKITCENWRRFIYSRLNETQC